MSNHPHFPPLPHTNNPSVSHPPALERILGCSRFPCSDSQTPSLLQIPVLVSDLDLECRMWIKIRLAPMAPYIGTLSLAFVGPPTIKVQLSPYGKVRLMRIPILQVRLLSWFSQRES